MAELVTVSTSRFGDLEYDPNTVIEVVGGVLGFPDSSKFIVLDYNPPFSWLQSTEVGDLAFVVVNAAEFGDEYTFPLPQGDPDLQYDSEEDVAILNIVTVRPDPTQTTVNLKAPIVVSLKSRTGKQIILDDEKFPVRFPLWSPSAEKEDAASETQKEESAEK